MLNVKQGQGSQTKTEHRPEQDMKVCCMHLALASKARDAIAACAQQGLRWCVDAAATGTGWTFSPCTVDAFTSTLGQALDTYRHHKDSFKELQARGMVRDSSWDKAAQEYEQIFEWAKVDQPYCR